jgi:cold shock CspA family protein
VQEKEPEPEIPQFMPSWMKRQPSSSTITGSTSNSTPQPTTPIIDLSPQSKFLKKEEKPEGRVGLPREKGVIHSVKDRFGFIKCYGRTELVFYHMNEVEDPHSRLQEGDEVEFILVPDSRTQGKELKATAIRYVRSTNPFGGNFNQSVVEHRESQTSSQYFQVRFFCLFN